QVKSPFLRLYLVFYGNLSFYLTPPSNDKFLTTSKRSYFVSPPRQLYHLFLIVLFNWSCEQPNFAHELLLAEAATFGKPLARLSFRLFDVTYRSLSAAAVLYCLLFGPEIVQILDELHHHHHHQQRLLGQKV